MANQKGGRPPDDGDGGAALRSPRELVMMARPDAGLRAADGTATAAADGDTGPLNRLLASAGATIAPLHGPSEDRTRARTAALGEAAQAEVPDLASYYIVQAPDDRLDELAAQLLEQELVEAAYVKPPGEPPVLTAEELGALEERINDMQPSTEDAPPASPDFSGRQLYLNAAPAGIDARYAWTVPGGKGAGVHIIDLEWGWQFTHEDLLAGNGGLLAGTNASDTNHGTAVLGEYSGDHNGTLGILGICPDARASAVAFSLPTATAIRTAADKLRAGDIMLLEIHRAGPNATGSGQFGFIAVEWWPDDLDAIRYAVAKGIIVVEAAGNGSQNLDDAVYNTRPSGFPTTWRNPFNTANPTSGAVVVGAGAPPPGTHGRDHGPDRSRLGFSNYGARVDAQGWGREVTTTGYGDLQGGGNRDLWYTDTFSGTSSASPIVVGALGCVQGVIRNQGGALLNSHAARTLVRSTGSPQQAAPDRPASQRIGNRPDLRQMIPAAARTWQTNKKVLMTYTTHHSMNAHAYIEGVGWRKVEPRSTDGVTNVFALLCEARANDRPVNAYVDGSLIHQLYLL
jgi:hypothetical protein